jgi:hypothetical protein
MVTSVLFNGIPEKRQRTGMDFKKMASDGLTNGAVICRDDFDTVITGQKASP